MRFRKSIKICKGVRMNFSKSGASLTIGGKGASVNFGKNGTYLNTGIPGTGLYDRVKISGGQKNTKKKTNRGSLAQNTNVWRNQIADKQNVTIDSLDSHYLDDSKIIEVYKEACNVYPATAYARIIEEMQPQKYAIQSFPVPAPDEKSVEQFLRKQYRESKKKGLKILLSKSKEDVFISSNINAALQEHLKAWNEAKKDFVEEEKRKKEQIDRQYKQQFLIEKEHLSKLYGNDIKTVNEAVDDWLSSVEFPFEFNADYMVEEDKLLIDLDLPEIEDLPNQYYRKMADGSYKLRDKTKKTIKEEYYRCVVGLTMCFVTNLFKCAIGINTVVLSAYTQRRNSSGEINDDYILSFRFTREQLAGMTVYKSFEDAEKALLSFNGRCKILSDKSFKTIEPF